MRSRKSYTWFPPDYIGLGKVKGLFHIQLKVKEAENDRGGFETILCFYTRVGTYEVWMETV